MRVAVTIGIVGLLLTVLMNAGRGEPNPPTESTTNGEYRGLVYPSKQVELTAPLPGVLKAVHVEEGQNVKADEVLAQMDDALQKIAVAMARMQAGSDTEVRSAKLELDEAEIKLERIEGIAAKGAAQEWEVRQMRVRRDLAKVKHENAIEQRELAKIKLEAELERLAQYQLEAPFDGQISRKIEGVQFAVEPGAWLTERDKVMVLRAFDPLEARLFLPTSLFGELEVGSEYRLKADLDGDEETPETDLSATLKIADKNWDPASGTFRCVFTIANPDAKLPSGFTVILPWPQGKSAKITNVDDADDE